MTQLKPCIIFVTEPQILVIERHDLLVYRGVNVALSCQYPWNVNMSMLKAAATQGHQTKTAQLKTAILMGMHSRWVSVISRDHPIATYFHHICNDKLYHYLQTVNQQPVAASPDISMLSSCTW